MSPFQISQIFGGFQTSSELYLKLGQHGTTVKCQGVIHNGRGKNLIGALHIRYRCQYLKPSQKLSCFKRGLDLSTIESMANASVYKLDDCPCLQNYFGSQCAIPGCVYKVPNYGHLPFELLSGGRRVIMGMIVNHEFEMTEIRLDAE